MPNIQFLSAENEIQKLYSQLGLVVPVGDLSTGKAPAVQPLSTSSTQTSVTASFNVMTGADLTAMSYTVNDGEAQSITPTKGVVTVTLTDLEYNSGPYAIKLTATNETGSTNVTSTVALQHYTNWATPDEVLEGNKYIGEDGQEAVGTLVPSLGIPGYLANPSFEFSVTEDPDTGEPVTEFARITEGSLANAEAWAAAGLDPIEVYDVAVQFTYTVEGEVGGTLNELHWYNSDADFVEGQLDISDLIPAQALLDRTFYLSTYEVFNYGETVGISSETAIYPEDYFTEYAPVIQSGQLEITDNGDTDVTGYDSVYVDVPTGPTDGGAVISNVTLTYTEDSSLDSGGSSRIAVTFSQLPEWDFTQHDYFATLYTSVADNVCEDYMGEKGVGQGIRYIGARLSSVECGYSMNIQDPTIWQTQNQLDMWGDSYPAIDSNSDPAFPDISQLQSPADGVLVIYEDKIWNQKWIIPCTITTTIIPEQNVGE